MYRKIKVKRPASFLLSLLMILTLLPVPALAAGDHPELVSAAVTSTGGLELTFDMAMADPSADAAAFSARRSDGSMRTGTAAALKAGDPTTIVLTLSALLRGGEVFTAAYTPGSVISSDGKTLEAFSNTPVTNGLPHPTLTDAALPAGYVGSAYNHTFAVSGGAPPYTFYVTLGTLPPGLTLSSAGLLSGVPTTAGSFWFRIQVSDAAFAVDVKEYTVTISALSAPTAPQALSAVPGDGQVKLVWAAPASDGGSPITKYEVSKDNGANWEDASAATNHTFMGLTNADTPHQRIDSALL